MSGSSMPVIASLDQHDLGLFDKRDGDVLWTRLAARVVLFNDRGQVAVMNFSKLDSYKLPGGGIDEGEDTIAALHREIEEETGYHIDGIRELGVVEEDRYFCNMHQTSYCFIAKVTSFVGTKLTEKESLAGMNLQWAGSTDEAIQWIESGKLADEDGSVVGLAMMKARDIEILRAAATAQAL